MSLYVIGDLHLSRGVHKPMDIFGPLWADHESRLIENWRLDKNDVVVLAGDTSWAMNLQELVPDFELLDSLPGHKILLKGNHDYWWTTQKKLNDFVCSRFPTISFLFNNTYETENAFICGTRGWLLEPNEEHDARIIDREVGRLRISLEAYKKTNSNKPAYVFLHYPPIFAGTVCTGIMRLLTDYGVTDCFYGHLHGSQAHALAQKDEYNGVRMHLIASDYLGFRPLRIDEKV